MAKDSQVAHWIERAVEIEAQIAIQQAELDALKDKLRGEAEARDNKDKMEFQSEFGPAAVIAVKDKTQLTKGANPEAIEIAPTWWNKLFVRKTAIVLAENFEESLAMLPKSEQKIVEKHVERKPMQSRVTLPKAA